MLIIESEHAEAGQKVIARMESNLAKYNRSKQKPYELSFSAGAVFYNGTAVTSILELFVKADELMYLNKKIRYGEMLK